MRAAIMCLCSAVCVCLEIACIAPSIVGRDVNIKEVATRCH